MSNIFNKCKETPYKHAKCQFQLAINKLIVGFGHLALFESSLSLLSEPKSTRKIIPNQYSKSNQYIQSQFLKYLPPIAPISICLLFRPFKTISKYKKINTQLLNAQFSNYIIIMFNNPQPQTNFNQVPTQPQQPTQNTQAAQLSLANVVQKLEAVHQLQTNPQLQSLIILLNCLQKQSQESVEKVCLSRDSLTKSDPSYHLNNMARFKTIKGKNQELLIRVLNLREKMVHQMYMYKIRSPKIENELDRLSQKIRHVRMRVNSKYTQLKYLKMSNQENYSLNKKKQEYNYSPLSVPLNDLKKGAEVIERQSIRLRQELNILIKHLHGEQI